jgi:hypothetical protein
MIKQASAAGQGEPASSLERGAFYAYRCSSMPVDRDTDLVVPPLPVRASIYIAPDGTVHFGALFAELVPVAAALGHPMTSSDAARDTSIEPSSSSAFSPTVAPG